MTAPTPGRSGPARLAEANARRGTPDALALLAGLALAAGSVGALSCGGESGVTPAPAAGGAAPTTPAPPSPEPPAPEPEPEPPEPPVLLGTPCYGIAVSANAPRVVDDWNRVTVVLDWDDAAFAEGFDWVSPYFDFSPDNYDARIPPPALEMSVMGWETAAAAPTVTRHALDLLWPPFREIGMRFRSARDACPLPLLVCGAEGCELRP